MVHSHSGLWQQRTKTWLAWYLRQASQLAENQHDEKYLRFYLVVWQIFPRFVLQSGST